MRTTTNKSKKVNFNVINKTALKNIQGGKLIYGNSVEGDQLCFGQGIC